MSGTRETLKAVGYAARKDHHTALQFGKYDIETRSIGFGWTNGVISEFIDARA